MKLRQQQEQTENKEASSTTSASASTETLVEPKTTTTTAEKKQATPVIVSEKVIIPEKGKRGRKPSAATLAKRAAEAESAAKSISNIQISRNVTNTESSDEEVAKKIKIDESKFFSI